MFTDHDHEWVRQLPVADLIPNIVHEIRMFPGFALGLIDTIRNEFPDKPLPQSLEEIEQAGRVIKDQSNELMLLRGSYVQLAIKPENNHAGDIEAILTNIGEIRNRMLQAAEQARWAVTEYEHLQAERLDQTLDDLVRSIRDKADGLMEYAHFALKNELPRRLRADLSRE